MVKGHRHMRCGEQGNEGTWDHLEVLQPYL